MKFLVDTDRATDANQVDAAIEVFIASGRADEILSGGVAGSLTPEQKRRVEAASAAQKAGSGPDADAADAAAAAIIVNEGNSGNGDEIDPIAKFSADNPEQPKGNFVDFLKDVGDAIGDAGIAVAEARDASNRKRVESVWKAFLTGKPGKNVNARKLLAAAASSPEGRAAVSERYKNARMSLPFDLRARLDKVLMTDDTGFAIPPDARLASEGGAAGPSKGAR
jgi:hypothetical protein